MYYSPYLPTIPAFFVRFAISAKVQTRMGWRGEGIPRRTAAADFDSKREGREGGTGSSSPSIWINYPKIGPVSFLLVLPLRRIP